MKEISELYYTYKESLKNANFGILSGSIDLARLEKVAIDLYAFRVAYVKHELSSDTGRNLSIREHNQLSWYLEQKSTTMKNGTTLYPGCLSFMFALEDDIISKITNQHV
jgi:hypothetical protein